MKILIVTSQINYMPDNYNGLIAGLLKGQFQDEKQIYEICAVANLKTLDKKLLSPLSKMPFVGMFGMSSQILKNIKSEQWDKKKELLCERYQIPLLNWESMNTQDALQWVKENDIDLILNIRTRCIYKKAILEAPKLGCINIHHGILPHYRGTLCDLYALSEYRPAGYSIHKMVRKIDDGEVYKVTEVYKREEGEKVDYMEYLAKTIESEIDDLTQLLSEISSTQKLPKPLEMTSNPSNIIYTKNPTPSKILKFIRQGIKL